jgi:Fe-S cluster biosynthesis and repair protein YggX
LSTPLSQPPFPGALGQRIFAEISQEQWDAWLITQTKIINEEKLNLSQPEDRKKLFTAMSLYFFAV